jgi:hypothetical protein
MTDDDMIEEPPAAVTDAALAAFASRRPGAIVLDLQAETLNTLCFSDDDVIADVILSRGDAGVQLQADVRGRKLASIALELIEPDGTHREVASAADRPACFLAKTPGMFALVITMADPLEPERVTAWCRLAD